MKIALFSNQLGKAFIVSDSCQGELCPIAYFQYCDFINFHGLYINQFLDILVHKFVNNDPISAVCYLKVCFIESLIL